MTKRPRKITKPLLIDEELPLQSGKVRRRDPKQPELPFDPMPDRIEPFLAKLASKPPYGDEWSSELKWDGPTGRPYRAGEGADHHPQRT